MKINLKDVIKIQLLCSDINTLLDECVINRRTVNNKKRKIQKILNNVTTDISMQTKIENCIRNNMYNTENLTYRPVCDALKELGCEVIRR